MNKLLIIPVVLSICMSMGGCPVRVDSNRNTSRNEVAYDQKFEFEYEVHDGTVNHGYVSDGSGLSANNETKQEPTGEANTPSVAPDTPVSNSQLVGKWDTVRRNEKYLYPGYIEFYADGTFSQGESEYTHTSYNPELFVGQPEGWHPVPMGFPYWYGTYTVEGNVITMTTLGDSVGSISDPSTQTLTIHSISDSDAIFGDAAGGSRYIKNFTPTDQENRIEELCALLGVDLGL